jgi:Holliday junction resolvase-like predicted endonuclease
LWLQVLFQPITESDDEIGNMVETAIYAQWMPRQDTDIHYANWRINSKKQGEVDIVGLNIAKQKPCWAVEVKWSDRYFEKPGELESLLYFMEKNKLSNAIVTSVTTEGQKNLKMLSLTFIPSACYAYIVGGNTLKQTRESYGL